MRQTENLEQEFIDAVIEDERQSSGEPERKVGRIILEKTELGQQEFDAEGSDVKER